jgi:hypothetical protein
MAFALSRPGRNVYILAAHCTATKKQCGNLHDARGLNPPFKTHTSQEFFAGVD